MKVKDKMRSAGGVVGDIGAITVAATIGLVIAPIALTAWALGRRQ